MNRSIKLASVAVALTLTFAASAAKVEPLKPGQGYAAFVFDTLDVLKSVKVNRKGGVNEELVASKVPVGKSIVVIPVAAGDYCFRRWYTEDQTSWEMIKRDLICFTVHPGVVSYSYQFSPRIFRTPEGIMKIVVALHDPWEFKSMIAAEYPEIWPSLAGADALYAERADWNALKLSEIGADLMTNRAYKDGFGYLQVAAKAGSPAGMRDLGDAYRRGRGTKADEAKALEWQLKGAAAGDARAALFACQHLELGRGTAEDPEKAVTLCRQAAEAGDKVAAWQLSRLHARSRGGLKPDSAEQARLMALAGDEVELGKEVVDKTLGFKDGTGAYRDGVEALRLATKRRDGSDRNNGAFALGYYYTIGVDGAPDGAKAVANYEISAKEGSSSAMWRLGDLYWRGAVVPFDAEKALYWFEKYTDKNPDDMNQLAWFLASVDDPEVRDGKRAVKIQKKVIDTKGETAALVDTLAAAYAAAGDYAKAVQTQKKAVALAIEAGWADDSVTKLRARIPLYESGKPYATRDP